MTQPFLPQCTVHPGVAAAAPCARCRRPFCSACLTTYPEQPLCLACHAALVGPSRPRLPEQRTDLRGTGRVELGRWIKAGWQLLMAEVGTWVLATLTATVVSAATCMVTFPAFYCGLFRMAFRQIRGERIAAGQVFWGFRRFGSSFGLGLLLTLPMLPLYGWVLSLLFRAFQKMRTPRPDFDELIKLMLTIWSAEGLLFLYSLLALTASFFAYARIAAIPIGPVRAFAASWQVVRRNFWMYLLTTLVLLLVQGLGAYALYVGFFFSYPLSILAWAQAYVDHFGLEDAQLD